MEFHTLLLLIAPWNRITSTTISGNFARYKVYGFVGSCDETAFNVLLFTLWVSFYCKMLPQTWQLFCQGITDGISQTSPPPLETVPEEEAELKMVHQWRHRFFSVIQSCLFKIFVHEQQNVLSSSSSLPVLQWNSLRMFNKCSRNILGRQRDLVGW